MLEILAHMFSLAWLFCSGNSFLVFCESSCLNEIFKMNSGPKVIKRIEMERPAPVGRCLKDQPQRSVGLGTKSGQGGQAGGPD